MGAVGRGEEAESLGSSPGNPLGPGGGPELPPRASTSRIAMLHGEGQTYVGQSYR